MKSVRTISCVVVHPLRVQNVVHRDHIIVLAQRTTAHPAKLLHMPADTEQKAEMDTERTNVRASFARDPEDSEVALLVELEELRLIDSPDTELTLDSRDERGSLEECAGECLDSARKSGRVGESGVNAKNSNVLLSCCVTSGTVVGSLIEDETHLHPAGT